MRVHLRAVPLLLAVGLALAGCDKPSAQKSVAPSGGGSPAAADLYVLSVPEMH